MPPSVLILKMKVPSNIDLETFDLRGNLTAALSNIVRESVRRVKRMKRSLPEDHNGQLVKVGELHICSSLLKGDLCGSDNIFGRCMLKRKRSMTAEGW